MASDQLRISRELSLPLDAATETIGILAVRRAGKSNAAVVLAEEMYDHGIPWVAVDPKGDWWGVRAAGSGNAPGLAVLVFGGQHGDVPLEPSAGRLVADLVVDQRITCVLDVSEMSKADQRRCLHDFADRLYRRNTEPLHVFCEEADEYIPQMVRGETAKVVGAFETLVKRGGFKGIGVTLVTQRSASLNKDVLTQVGTLVMLRTTSPQDQKVVEAWIKYHAGAVGVLSELAGLQDGEAWIYSPSWLNVLEKIRFRKRRTFDSGATPKVGVRPRTPTRLADVDVGAIKEAMAETIERVQAEDPRELRKKIRQLEREMERMSAAALPPAIEVPVLTDNDRTVVEAAIERLEAALASTEQMTATLRQALDPVTPKATRPIELPVPRVGDQIRVRVRPETIVERTGTAADGNLAKAERAVLTVLAQHGQRTTTQVAIIAGYSHKSGGYRNSLSSLRTKGFIEGRGEVEITPAGADALGDYDPLPTGRALAEWWKEHQLGKSERSILDVLLDAYPQAVPVSRIAELTGYSAGSGGFRNSLSRLRSLELADGRGELRLNPALA